MTATKSVQTPPQPLLVFTNINKTIAAHAKELIEPHGVFLDNLVKEVTPETATFQNVAEALEYNTPRFELSFLKYVSPDAEVRNAVTQAEQAIEAHTNQSMMRDDVFRLLDAVYQKRASLKLDEEAISLLERQHLQYQLQGIALAPGAQRDQLQQIQDETGNLIGNFIRNTLQENGGIWFSKSELDGVSEDALKTFQVGTDENEGKLRANFKMPHVTVILGNCHDSETRKRMYIGNQNKCNSNSDIPKRIALLRHQKAQLLGFETHAAEQLSQKMAKTPMNVHVFLTKLQERYTPSAKQESEKLKSLKEADLTARGAPDDGRFYLWDNQYYTRALKEAEYNIDYVEFSQFFALDRTVARMLGIYEDLMGFRFQRLNTSDLEMLSPTGKAEDVIWHDDNMVYSVWDENETGGGFIGYLYMDLHPRPGKFTNAAQMGIRTGCTFSDGARQYPATALVCNFSPPTPEKPSLLKHIAS
ncbi:hypothetical protein VHEMI09220 [[Torrubiella] hemipterigena]|uniref:Peptidase M3A/M3B catalytic domain-containing protein n=1 Tax=[Torrubiella] hemipterigena TaxID=1531966 RepID=A0A0A1TFU8_9HYPO|nr:hypothetical protein VHEMI09220 [[Torrubiella] hemipterigena]